MTGGMLATNASRRSWKIAIGTIVSFVAAVLLIQVWAANNLLNGTEELRRILSTSQAAANRLERSIGYGGLIHNFKNYVLRPDEDKFRLAAQEDARGALVLIEKLRANASDVGIIAPLERSREMIISYAERLDSVRQLAEAGHSREFIDEQIRFDDQPALIEVEALITQLDETIDNRLTYLQREAAIATVLIFICTVAAGLFYLLCFVTRQRKHFNAVKKLADRLSYANESLSRANSSLNQFAGIVSHDLKVPLIHISFFRNQLTENLNDPAIAKANIDKIQRSTDSMNKIIESLLDFSRTGFTEPKFESVDLRSILAEVEQSFEFEIQDNNARLSIDLKINQPVQADYALLLRVLSNLIANSLKYKHVDSAPEIEIRGIHAGEVVEISISDNGIGIKPRYADRIFEPLQRLHGTQEEYAGSGIGLSLVKSIIEGHMGQIHLDTTYTHGTRIVFTLPCPAAVSLTRAA